jgi:hypothetical protein
MFDLLMGLGALVVFALGACAGYVVGFATGRVGKLLDKKE